MARNIRTRLENSESQQDVVTDKEKARMTLVEKSSGNSSTEKVSELDELSFGKAKRIHVQEFACVFAIIAFAVASYYLLKHSDLDTAIVASLVGSVLVLLGYRAPKILLPLWKGWMAIAHVLGACMTFLILSIMWFLVALPISFLLKAIGKKVMDLRYDKALPTYWEDREDKQHDFKLLERQF